MYSERGGQRNWGTFLCSENVMVAKFRLGIGNNTIVYEKGEAAMCEMML